MKTTAGTEPRHLVFSPTLPLAYVGNERGGSVTAYKIDANTGQLARQQTVASLPKGFQGKNATAEVRLHPSGKILYLANRGHDSIARFAIGSDGAMQFAGTTPTEPTPRSFDISTDGQFLTAAGEASGKLAIYRIDSKTGDLTQTGTAPAGKMAWWVMSVGNGRGN